MGAVVVYVDEADVPAVRSCNVHVVYVDVHGLAPDKLGEDAGCLRASVLVGLGAGDVREPYGWVVWYLEGVPVPDVGGLRDYLVFYSHQGIGFSKHVLGER